MEQATSVVCICETHEQAKRAMKSLQDAGIDMQTLSTATRDVAGEHPAGYYYASEQMFKIPGIGTLLVGGPLASWIVSALEGGAGWAGVTIVGAALATLGISHDSVLQYEAALTTDKCLVVLHGSPAPVATAVKVIGGTTHCSHTIHGERVYDTVHGPTMQGMYADMYQV